MTALRRLTLGGPSKYQCPAARELADEREPDRSKVNQRAPPNGDRRYAEDGEVRGPSEGRTTQCPVPRPPATAIAFNRAADDRL